MRVMIVITLGVRSSYKKTIDKPVNYHSGNKQAQPKYETTVNKTWMSGSTVSILTIRTQ